MRTEHEAMMVIRAELCDRLESLEGRSHRLSGADFHAAVEGIRSLAGSYGMTPVVRLADALERSAAGEGARRGGASELYSRIRDAIGCGRADEAAAQAMLASVAVRLGG
jgi:hypothetical protein